MISEPNLYCNSHEILDMAADITIQTHSCQLHVKCNEKTRQNRDNVTTVKLQLYCN